MAQSGLERKEQGGGIVKWIGILSSTQQTEGSCEIPRVGENNRKTTWPVCRSLQCPNRMFGFYFPGKEEVQCVGQTKPSHIKRG